MLKVTYNNKGEKEMNNIKVIRNIYNEVVDEGMHIPKECVKLVNVIKRVIDGSLRPINLKIYGEKVWRKYSAVYSRGKDSASLDIRTYRWLESNATMMWVLTHITELEEKHMLELIENADIMLSECRV